MTSGLLPVVLWPNDDGMRCRNICTLIPGVVPEILRVKLLCPFKEGHGNISDGGYVDNMTSQVIGPAVARQRLQFQYHLFGQA